MPSPQFDTRMREYLGGKSHLYIAKNFIDENIANLAGGKSAEGRNLLFACAPSGGGKSRYVQEVSKICQQKKINYVMLQYRAIDFWDHAIHWVMQRFKGAKTTLKMRGRLFQVMESTDLAPKKQLFGRYLVNLSSELNGLVLFIDGLSQQLPANFLDPLKAIAKKNQKGHGEKVLGQTKLAFILSINPNALPHELAEEKEGAQAFSQLVAELSNRGEFNLNAQEYADQSWRNMPEQVRILALEGLARLLILPTWQEEEICFFLREVFPEIDFSPEFLPKILSATQGNAGFLQAICDEALAAFGAEQNLSGPLVQDLLLEVSRGAFVQDLQVYKLKYYDEEGKALLALLAALGTCTRELIDRVWQDLFGEKGLDKSKGVLIRAFDDGLIQIEQKSEQDRNLTYSLFNQNLKKVLQQLGKKGASPIGFLLRKILTQGQDLLATRDLISLAQFLDRREIWAKGLIQYFNEEKETSKRLSIIFPLEELRKRLSMVMDFEEVDWDTRLSLDYVTAELFFLQKKFKESIKLSEGITFSLKDRNDPEANALRIKAQLFLGISYCIKGAYKESIEILQETIDSELLGDTDHYFALGRMAECQLRLLGDKGADDNEYFSYLNEARKYLRIMDPVRYAILTGALGWIYFSQKFYLKSLPYFELASRVFGEKREIPREILLQKQIGKTNYLLGQYHAALDVFNQTLPSAERYGLDHDSVEILIYTIRTHFMMGNIKKLGPTLLQLTSLCDRMQDFSPLMQIIEPAANTYLEEGKMLKALNLVQTQLKHLDEKKDSQAKLDAIICELLLVQIYYRMGRWEQAQKHDENVSRMILTLSGKHAQAESAQQVHMFYHIDFLRHEKGAKVALYEMEKYINEDRFSGFILNEAYFKAFQLAVWAEMDEAVERFIPRCMQVLKKVSSQERMAFYVDLAKHYLDRHELEKAKSALKSAAALLNMVTNHITRAQVFDQQARLAQRQGKRQLALKRWNHADQEFRRNLRTWQSEDREQFKESSPEWQEHRVVFMTLNAGRA
jgi:hypothetical protein